MPLFFQDAVLDPLERFVQLANQGARELGFANLAELWNSRYDMKPADFQAETERLWEQVKPLIERHLGDLSIPVYVYTTYRRGEHARE